jgi:hypothetical protein
MQHRPIRRLQPNDQALSEVLTLICTSFAFMTGRIDPPSSMHQLTVQDPSDQAQASWILAMGDPVEACVVASPLPHALYLGKMVVDAILRGQAWGGSWWPPVWRLRVKWGMTGLNCKCALNWWKINRLSLRQAL